MINKEETILIAVFSFVFTEILCSEGMILSDVRKYVYKLPIFNHAERMYEGLGYHPLFKVLFGCPICLSGQLSLWYYVITTDNYNIISNILTVSTTIFATWLLMQLNKKINE